MYAIRPKGAGKKVGARAIRPDWALTKGERFKVDKWHKNMVLADDKLSLREMTEEEIEEANRVPTQDEENEKIIKNDRTFNALVKALNDGSFELNQDYTDQELIEIIKARM